MLRKLFTLPVLILVLGFTIVWLWPTAPVGTPITLPTATPSSLPLCGMEDGSGQALCMWDADTQGNGMGNDVVSGECASTNVPQQEACINLWHTDNGIELVRECMDIEHEAMWDNAFRIELDNDGWNLTECFKAQLQ